MPTTDPRVDAYIAASRDFAQPILRRLRKVVHAGCPNVEETLKWGAPAFMYKGPLAGMSAFKEHCRFGLWKGSLLKDLHLSASGEMSGPFAKIRSIADLPTDQTLIKQVKEAAALNERGVKVVRPKRAVKPVVVPPYFRSALKKNKKALAAFEAFSPSHKREYVAWVTEARTEETRARRMQTTLEWLAEGKSRHWKYQGR
jgi:uncharacterized protein YdeI (YjbR/CyaY-like superfamily)